MHLKIIMKTTALITVVLFITGFFELSLSAESIFLKDGSILNGTIVSASDDAVILRMDDDTLKKIPRKKVIKILYIKHKKKVKNIQPDRPVISSIEKTGSDDRYIKWLATSDPDGVVINYRIYGTIGDIRKIIAEVKDTEYYLENASIYDRIELAAVDNKLDESDSIKVHVKIKTVNDNKNIVCGLYPGMIFIMGESEKICETGYGGILSLTWGNTNSDGFEAGFNTGFYYAQGKDHLKEGKPNYHRFIFVPFYLSTGYRFNFGNNFSITPLLSIGGAYINTVFTRKSLTTLEESEISFSFIDPIVKTGLQMRYRITTSVSMALLAEYGMFIESAGSIPFVNTNLGIEYIF